MRNTQTAAMSDKEIERNTPGTLLAKFIPRQNGTHAGIEALKQSLLRSKNLNK